ncbi:glycosyltransferase family 2 protein [Clostridium beijerinckii]|uniref:Glycosyltransferase n=1 Tax=Clostridium beijerinckii TaxID=1520 RepID=A0A7X9SMX6_CLOBE|nr:glycosyltransferase family 2 protein [Clostridium beijerinckii]NMF04829.1 glycosyltransferase [Clostridium beijerinckii]
MEELVSIVIPVYNVEKYIDQCLDCITNQTYKNIQIIVINDGSTDSTKEKLKSWEKNDNRITVINKKNEGVSIARNCGIDSAYGKYIFFFDGDDTVELKCLEKVVSKAEENEFDTILYGYASLRKNKILNHKLPYNKNEYLLNRDIIEKVVPHSIGISYKQLEEWLQGKRGIREGKELNGPWRMCYSTQIIKENNIKYNENLKVGEDTIFTNEYLSYSNKVAILDECFYYLHNHEESTISRYLENVDNMINNKKILLNAKKHLSNLIEKRTGIDISEYWGGEVILSTVQIAWLLTNKVNNESWYQRYKIFKEFANDKEVRQCWKRFDSKMKLSIKAIPLLLIKYRMNLIVFILMSIFKKSGFKINVG